MRPSLLVWGQPTKMDVAADCSCELVKGYQCHPGLLPLYSKLSQWQLRLWTLPALNRLQQCHGHRIVWGHREGCFEFKHKKSGAIMFCSSIQWLRCTWVCKVLCKHLTGKILFTTKAVFSWKRDEMALPYFNRSGQKSQNFHHVWRFYLYYMIVMVPAS